MADLVIASTPAIAEKYAPHGRSVVIRNCVPESVFSIQKKIPEQPRVGWSGSVGTHPYDLDVAGTQIGTFLHTNDTPLSIVGDGEWVREKLYIRDDTDVSITGWVPLEDYMQTVADNIDIGLVPLELSRFNEAKSYLKGLEMAALGIPFIASPTSEYQFFAGTFGGRIAKKPRDWAKHLKALLSDRDLLLAESAELKESVRDQTYEKQIHQWIDAWELAIAMKRKESVVQ
jgi:glycosyltransferase involved in cell wall biosynthesis